MDKNEFIEACQKGGYATKKVAMAYAEDKDEFTDNDFIEIYREVEKTMQITYDSRRYGNHTTKRYKQSEKMGSDRNV